MHVIRLLSASGGTEVGQFPFCLISQPSAGFMVGQTVKIGEGAYAQAPGTRVDGASNTTTNSIIYTGLLLTYSSADGVRPEQNHFLTGNANYHCSTLSKIGTKEYTLVMNQSSMGDKHPQHTIDYHYNTGYPVDVTSGQSTFNRSYQTQIQSNQSPAPATPPGVSAVWYGYFVIFDSTVKNIQAQGNASDYSGVVFKTFFGRTLSGSVGGGYIERLDGGSVTWKKQLGDHSKGDPQKGIRLYPCGTNGEDTLLVYSSDGGMAVIEADGTVRWHRDMLDGNTNPTSCHFVAPNGDYAYTTSSAGELFKIDLSDGTMQVTTTTFATGTPNLSGLSNAQSNYTGGFDSDGYLWVSNPIYGCLTRMDVSGANPIAIGSYQFKDGASDAVPAFAPLVDGDRIVCQLMRKETNLRSSWFCCLPTDLSVDTIDQYNGVYTREYGIGSGIYSGTLGIDDLSVYTTNNQGSWGAASTNSGGALIYTYTGSYDYYAAAAIVDQRMPASTYGLDVIRSHATLVDS